MNLFMNETKELPSANIIFALEPTLHAHKGGLNVTLTVVTVQANS